MFLFDARLQQIVKATDYAMISMSDYSVYVTPRTGHFFDGPLSGKSHRQEFITSLNEYIRTTILRHDRTPVEVALIADDEGSRAGQIVPAIWPVYNEDENIRMWERKTTALLALEARLTPYTPLCTLYNISQFSGHPLCPHPTL